MYFQSYQDVIRARAQVAIIRMGFLSPEDHPALICTGAPFLLGVSYVASLYVSETNNYVSVNDSSFSSYRFGDPTLTEIILTPSKGDLSPPPS